MVCLSRLKSSKKEPKKSWKCWKAKSKEAAASKKRKRKGSKGEESSKKKGCKGCFICKRSSKGKELSRKKGKCGMCCFGGTKSSSEEPLKQKGEGYKLLKCCVCAKSSEKNGCFSCFKSSEEPLKQNGEGYKLLKCCVCANSSEKKGRFSCFKSPDEPLKQKGEGYKLLKCKGCFSCFKSSEEPLKQKGDGHKLLKCCVCAKSSERNGCFSCFKSCKKKELRKQGEKAIAKSSEGKAPKQRCLKGLGCSCGCLCCSSSAHKNLNKGKGKKVLCWKKKVLCWKKKEKKKKTHLESLVKTMSLESDSSKHRSAAKEILRISNGNIAARIFTYREIAAATRDFAPECLLGKGGFGKVYKGLLMETKKTVAVKKLDRSGYQGNREFLVEVLMLSLLSHHNLVNLLGYCTDRDERILVYDYMPHGSLEDHLFDLSPDSKPLDWNTRMKIAVGAARGLEHLHDTANPPVIYRDFKASNILLDRDFNPRLADFGLAKLGPVGAKNHVTTRVMGTFGYCAPEYALTGKLTMMSDIYSLGVVLLELITGRKAMDPTRPRNEQRLVDWVRPLFKDKKKFMQMADPLLEGNFPVKPLYQALAIAAMCIQESDTSRPIIKDVVLALHFLTMPNNNRPSEEVPENSILDSVTTNDEDSPDSSHSSQDDWQSCSTGRTDVRGT